MKNKLPALKINEKKDLRKKIKRMYSANTLTLKNMNMFKKTSFTLALFTLILTASENNSPALINILKTKKEHSLGCIFSYYSYTEPNLMNKRGGLLGMDYNFKQPFSNGLFFMLQTKITTFLTNYSSKNTGSSKNNRGQYIKIKPCLGTDFYLNDKNVIAPYIGIGFRYLISHENDNLTTTGHRSYFRTNKLLFIPIGVMHRFKVDATSYIETTIEGSYVILGRQFSKTKGFFSHRTNGVSFYDTKNLYNKQNKGYGYKFSMEYNQEKWAVGPYFSYWHIDKSDTVGIPTQTKQGNIGQEMRYSEPKNNTIETGITLRYKL